MDFIDTLEDTLNPDVCYCILALSSTLLSAAALLGFLKHILSERGQWLALLGLPVIIH